MKNNRHNKIKIIISVLLFFSSLFVIQAKTQSSSYLIKYLKGNIKDKTEAIQEARINNDYSLALKAIDFSINEHDTLGDDIDLIELVKTAIQTIDTTSPDVLLSSFSENLITVFNIFNNDDIKIVVLKELSLFPTEESVSTINSFLQQQAQNRISVNPVIIEAVNTIGKIGNNSSFSLLFAIVLDGIWANYEQEILSAIGPLANNSDKEIMFIFNDASLKDKYKILSIISENKNISTNIKGEVAENALSVSISSIESTNDFDKDRLLLQLLAIKVLAETKWTRAAMLVSDSFNIIKSEYDNQIISGEVFSSTINNMASVGSSEICVSLSNYLNSLNKEMEKGNAPENVIVLSIINSLGSLGDKSAFDVLLYVTYLEYPEQVTSAARNSLSKLKW